eukprot:gnl/TRDRNA2_/TRDRNA2_177534_c2_seq10.p2 gnl/TRDRNA2_/TRDRNA2_177534_c2~~gnl/TRDRNA2_/TRDRNA2_177534_c2_seq10.p2  ORF type:complete len:343 (+),score=82.59 gnl/TRDRNA2_/TRDRNA2_177534_c2_seq10:1775-2803(+)
MDKLYKLVQMEFDVDLDEYIKGCQNKDVSGLDGLPTGKHYKCSHGGGSALERPRSYPLYCDGRKIDKEMPENELFDGRSSDNTPLTPDFDEDKETIEVDPDHEFIVLQVGWFPMNHDKTKVDGKKNTELCNTLVGSGWYWLRSDAPGAVLGSGDGPENAFEVEFKEIADDEEEEEETLEEDENEEETKEKKRYFKITKIPGLFSRLTCFRMQARRSGKGNKKWNAFERASEGKKRIKKGDVLEIVFEGDQNSKEKGGTKYLKVQHIFRDSKCLDLAKKKRFWIAKEKALHSCLEEETDYSPAKCADDEKSGGDEDDADEGGYDKDKGEEEESGKKTKKRWFR